MIGPLNATRQRHIIRPLCGNIVSAFSLFACFRRFQLRFRFYSFNLYKRHKYAMKRRTEIWPGRFHWNCRHVNDSVDATRVKFRMMWSHEQSPIDIVCHMDAGCGRHDGIHLFIQMGPGYWIRWIWNLVRFDYDSNQQHISQETITASRPLNNFPIASSRNIVPLRRAQARTKDHWKEYDTYTSAYWKIQLMSNAFDCLVEPNNPSIILNKQSNGLWTLTFTSELLGLVCYGIWLTLCFMIHSIHLFLFSKLIEPDHSECMNEWDGRICV